MASTNAALLGTWNNPVDCPREGTRHLGDALIPGLFGAAQSAWRGPWHHTHPRKHRPTTGDAHDHHPIKRRFHGGLADHHFQPISGKPALDGAKLHLVRFAQGLTSYDPSSPFRREDQHFRGSPRTSMHDAHSDIVRPEARLVDFLQADESGAGARANPIRSRATTTRWPPRFLCYFLRMIEVGYRCLPSFRSALNPSRTSGCSAVSSQACKSPSRRETGFFLQFKLPILDGLRENQSTAHSTRRPAHPPPSRPTGSSTSCQSNTKSPYCSIPSARQDVFKPSSPKHYYELISCRNRLKTMDLIPKKTTQ